MFWADRLAKEIQERRKGAILIRDEKTPSGRVHVGSMRGVAIHGAVSEVLTEKGVPNTFKYEFNDLDPMDGFPEYLPDEFRKYMGMPLRSIPSPDGKAANFAEYFAQEFKDVIEHAGFSPVFYNVSELYFSGQMDECIRIALDHASDIRRIYQEVSGSKKPDDWYPLNVICENCGKVGTTKVFAWDGTTVSYRCEPKMVTWAEGCGHEGAISPFGGKAKFPFKVEWPAKWKVVGVMFEGAGKDHSTKGGARDVAAHIAKEVFSYQAPEDAPYEFFLVGGKKMSSSKGRGSSAKEISDLLPTHIFRLALLQKDIMQAINFDPSGDTIPVLFDTYDRLAKIYWDKKHPVNDLLTTDATENTPGFYRDDYVDLFKLIHLKEDRGNIKKIYLPRFSLIAFLVQMQHLNIYTEIEKMKVEECGEKLTDEDRMEIELRSKYARFWLDTYAPDDFKFELQKNSLPEQTKSFSDKQKALLKEVLAYVESEPALDGQNLHTKLHEIRKASDIDAKDFFSAIYFSFLGKENGPKAGWFLSVLDKDFLIKRLKEVTQ